MSQSTGNHYLTVLMVKSWLFVMVFVVDIIRISVMVSIVFVSRVTMGFVMLFAIYATGLL